MAADASYIIDIAAQMGGAEATLGELDTLTAKLTASGKNAQFFQDAIKRVAGELDAASKSALSANAALDSGKAHYAELEKAALQAGKAADKAAAKNAGVVPPELAAKLAAAQGEVNSYVAELRKLEGAAKAADDKEAHLGQTLANVRKLNQHTNTAIAGQTERLEKLAGGLNAVGGPLGVVGAKTLGLAKGFSSMSAQIGASSAAALLGVTAFFALAAAAAAVSAAVVYGAAKLAIFAVGLADSKRSADLAAEAFGALNPELAGLPFAQVSKQTGQSADSLRKLAKQLEAAKVKAADMPAALEAAALAETALGQGGAQEFINQIGKGGAAVSKLAATTKQQLGGIVAKQLLGLDAQSAQLKTNIGGIFGGLNIDPVLQGMQILVGLFDSSSVAGKTLKFLFETIFQPIIDQATNAAYVVEAFYLGFLIGATKLYINLKPTIKAISEFFGFDSSSLTDALSSAKAIGELIAPVFIGIAAVVGGVLLLAVGAVGAVIAAQVAIWYGFGAAIGFVIDVAKAIGAGFNEWIVVPIQNAFNFIASIDLATMGANLIMGFVNGIVGSVGAVIDAVKNAVGAAIGAAKGLLGISSPSKVFAEIGGFTGEGFTQGVEAENDNAQAAVAALADPTSAFAAAATTPAFAAVPNAATPAAAEAAAAAGNKTSGPAVHIENVYFAGTKASEQEVAQLAEQLTRLLEGDATALGSAAEAVA